jgi:soluble lytic murein transglycosylase-like protein
MSRLRSLHRGEGRPALKRAALMIAVVLACQQLAALSPRDFVDYDTQLYARELGIPFAIAERLKASESSNERYAKAWEPTTDSWSLGWWGLNTRWLPDFARRFNGGAPVDPYDAVVSTRVALRLLASLYWQTGDWREAVYAYKGGEGELAWQVAGYVVTGTPWPGMSH